jgi:sugar lactone lactonase YvrE
MKIKQFSLLFLLGILIFILSSCSKNMRKINTVTDDNVIVYPAPPTTPRFQYLTSINNSEDIVGKRSKVVSFLIGKRAVGNISKPYGATIKNGKIYICDQGAGVIEIIDLEKGSFNFFQPSGLGRLISPFNCSVDENNNLYVADIKRKQVLVYNPRGEYLNAFGDTGTFRPVDVFVHNKKVWVADIKGMKISVYDTDSSNTFLYDLIDDKTIDTKDKLYAPTNIYVTDSHVYVSDNGDYKIKKYTHKGKFVASVGALGTGLGQFSRPKGIAVDRDLNLFAIDGLFENVQIFNDKQQLLMALSSHYQGPGGLWLPATIAIDYDHLEYFQHYVHPRFKLKYLVMVTNQYGPDKINIYGAIEPIK